MRMAKATLCALIAGAVVPMLAHDMYLLPARFAVSKGETLTIALHNGDAFPESEVSPVIERLRDARLFSLSATSGVTGLREEGKRVIGTVVVPGEGNLILAVRSEPNFIQLDGKEFTAYLKEEGLDEVIDWRAKHAASAKPGREQYSKFAKSLLVAGSPNGYYKHVVGFPIDIVPEADPSQLKPGDTLPVQVIFRGKPAAGLQVEAAWAKGAEKRLTIVGRTDGEGRIRVPISAAGIWRLHSIHMQQAKDISQADWESFWASLTFEIR